MKDVSRKMKKAIKKSVGSAFTREVLIDASSRAIQQASKRAMETSGYVVVAEGDWIVRIDKNGLKERVAVIESTFKPQSIELD